MLIVYPFLVALYEKEKLMDKLKFVFFALTIALSTTALAATYYQEALNKTKKLQHHLSQLSQAIQGG